ncbi:MAG TPA: MgtC/SapB family protein [Chthonomonadales bacterium]|nr:MgtC/SapB family protein [Chthonomonadales bacterium]
MGVDQFFGHTILPLTLGGKTFALLLSLLLGGAIGFERQIHGTAAGLRTHILVCMGAAVMTLTSVEIGLGVRGAVPGDPGHVAAQIVSGVGFLGAGAILRSGASVRGLTTAASIWASAGIGMAVGASPRLAELAVVATFLALATLYFIEKLETRFRLKQVTHTIEIELSNSGRDIPQILGLLAQLGFNVLGIDAQANSILGGGTERRRLEMQVQLPMRFNREEFNRQMAGQRDVVSFLLSA